MKTNVGSYDCAFRFVAGCIALLVGNHYLSWWGLVGCLPILTSIIGFCPAYVLFGINTTTCDQHEHRMKGFVSHAAIKLDARLARDRD